jgi:hypothetical protein
MAAVDELVLDGNEASGLDFREVISLLFWDWFDKNQDQKVTVVSVWLIRKTLYVRDLRSVFSMLFGLHP